MLLFHSLKKKRRSLSSTSSFLLYIEEYERIFEWKSRGNTIPVLLVFNQSAIEARFLSIFLYTDLVQVDGRIWLYCLQWEKQDTDWRCWIHLLYGSVNGTNLFCNFHTKNVQFTWYQSIRRSSEHLNDTSLIFRMSINSFLSMFKIH